MTERDVAAQHLENIAEDMATESRLWKEFRDLLLRRIGATYNGSQVTGFPSVSNGLVLNSNSNRKGSFFHNDAAGGAGDVCYLKFGTSPSTGIGDASLSLAVGQNLSLWERLPGYQGLVWVFWPTSVGGGRLLVTDFT